MLLTAKPIQALIRITDNCNEYQLFKNELRRQNVFGQN
jgi:hypothetical protein